MILSREEKPTPVNPLAMPIPDAARLLTAVGGQAVTEATIRADMEAGAPTNADETLNLVHYAAWLLKEMARGD
jgi:hypothetical protein